MVVSSVGDWRRHAGKRRRSLEECRHFVNFWIHAGHKLEGDCQNRQTSVIVIQSFCSLFFFFVLLYPVSTSPRLLHTGVIFQLVVGHEYFSDLCENVGTGIRKEKKSWCWYLWLCMNIIIITTNIYIMRVLILSLQHTLISLINWWIDWLIVVMTEVYTHVFALEFVLCRCDIKSTSGCWLYKLLVLRVLLPELKKMGVLFLCRCPLCWHIMAEMSPSAWQPVFAF